MNIGRASHGGKRAYEKGCRCAECTAGNTARCRSYRARAAYRDEFGEVR